MTAPNKQMAHPSLPNVPSSSLRKYDPRTAPIRTLRAPNGVTRIAGANAYAAKLHISPRTTVVSSLSAAGALDARYGDIGPCSHVAIPAHHNGLRRYTNPSPSKPCRSSACIKPCVCGEILAKGPFCGSMPWAQSWRGWGLGRRSWRRTFFVMAKLVPVRNEILATLPHTGIIGSRCAYRLLNSSLRPRPSRYICRQQTGLAFAPL